MDFADHMCENGMMLEPRLMEYVTRKIKYKKDHVEATIPLEKMFRITREDKAVIKKYLKGNKVKSRWGSDEDLIAPNTKPFKSSQELFKEDPRYQRLQTKLRRNREAQQHRYDSNIAGDYDISGSDARFRTAPDSGRNIRPHNHTKRRSNNDRDMFLLDSSQDPSKYDNPRYLDHPNVRNNQREPHHEPKVQYRRSVRYSQDYDEDHPRPYVQQRHSQVIDDIDDYKSQVGSHRRHYEENQDQYHTPYPYQHSRNVDMDTYIRNGYNSRGGKKVGYENPVEHYFDYIDPEIQEPRHVLSDRGVSTRMHNKSRGGRNYSREILP